MRRSVSWHFLLYSLAIILVAVVAVGLVTLILVDANFSRQEEQYLRDRGDQLVEPLESAFQLGSDPADIQSIASLGLVTSHVRIRVVDRSGRVLADSGSYSELFESQAPGAGEPPAAAFQLLLDESGHFHGLRMPAEAEIFGPMMMPGIWREHQETQPFIAERAPQPPIADVSDVAVTLPLQVDSQVVGHAELSEGPAFGQAIRDILQQALIIGGVVALLVAAVAAVVAARQVTRPLQSLGAAADDMAQGDLQARADGSSLAEIDHLATRFNSMADQLATTIASLESERASLRRFIADASHELRTPLTALKTFNTLLAQDMNQDAGRPAKLVQESGRQLDHLDRLTTDLLDLSRLEARLNGAPLTTGDIRPVVEEAVMAARPASEAKRQTLLLTMPEAPVEAAHDAAMLERAVHNLVSNAVKFTPQGGRVQVEVRVEEMKAAIHVRDDGLGVPLDEQAHVFDRFFRGRGAGDEGSGLGLAIAREIATIHEGTISITSEPDQGSHFVLTLRLAGS